MEYYLYINDERIGPLEVSEIIKSLKDNKYKLSDLIYDYELEKWIAISDHKHLMSLLMDSDESEEITVVDEEDKADSPAEEILEDGNNKDVYLQKEWFVLKEKDRYGPFDHKEMVQMLNSDLISEFHYAWKAEMDNWTKIAMLKDFEKSKIDKIANLFLESFDDNIQDQFFRRRYPRDLCDVPVIVFSGGDQFLAKLISISDKGAGILIENVKLNENDPLTLQFNLGEELPDFEVRCKVVNLSSNQDGSCRYGLEFILDSEDKVDAA